MPLEDPELYLSEEQDTDKLYPFVPVSLIPVIIYTVITLGILLFDSTGKYSTNPVIFYSVPFLYTLILLIGDSIPVVLSVIGLWLPDLRSKIVAGLSIPLGAFLGWGLVQISKVQGSIFKIATYPWSVTSLYTAGALSTFTPSTSFFLYLVVAVFEEVGAVIMGKNIANWIHSKGLNSITASILGYMLGRIVLVTHHWFSYNGVQNISLYISAFGMFVIFTMFGLLTGYLAKGTKDDLATEEVIPILIPVMIMAHLFFDFVISQLMIIS
jgi:hypothetical protein